MQKYSVLIIEDDDFLLQMYVTKLDLEGYNVLSATNGVQGLKLIQREKPDLVLLDLGLPEMDGYEVLEKMKADNSTKNIPVLILSNFSQKENIDRALKLGADDYLIKAHFVPSEVIVKIKRILAENT